MKKVCLHVPYPLTWGYNTSICWTEWAGMMGKISFWLHHSVTCRHRKALFDQKPLLPDTAVWWQGHLPFPCGVGIASHVRGEQLASTALQSEGFPQIKCAIHWVNQAMEKAPSNGVSTQVLFAPKGFDVDIKLNMESKERGVQSIPDINPLTVKFWWKEVESIPDPFLMWSWWGHNLILCHQPKTSSGSMEWPKVPTGRQWGIVVGTMHLEPWSACMCDVPHVGFSFLCYRVKASSFGHILWEMDSSGLWILLFSSKPHTFHPGVTRPFWCCPQTFCTFSPELGGSVFMDWGKCVMVCYTCLWGGGPRANSSWESSLMWFQTRVSWKIYCRFHNSFQSLSMTLPQNAHLARSCWMQLACSGRVYFSFWKQLWN